MFDLERDLEDRGRRRRRRRRDEARGEARGTRRLGREREEEIDPDVLRESEVQLDDMFEPAGQPAAEGGLEAAAAGEGDESAEVRETTGPNGERLDADGFAIVEEEDAAARPLNPLEREEERDAPPLDAPEFETRANANGGETEGVALPVAREEPEPAADASEEALSLDELSDLAAVSAGTTTPDPAEEAPRPADDQAAAFEAETGAAEASEAAEASPDDPASLRAAAEAAAAEAAAAAETARAAAEKAAEAAAKAAAAGGGDAAAATSEEAAAASEASPDDAFAAAAAAASEPPVETAADGDAPRGPRVTPDMTYEEQQQEFARFAREEAERNDRIAREAAEANEIAAAAAAEEPPRIPAEAESAAAAALGKDESHPGKRGSKKPKASAKEGREEAEAKNGKAKKAKDDAPSDDAPSDDDAASPSSPDVYDPSVEGYDPTRWTGPRPDEHPMWEKLISNTADEVLDDAESSSGDFSLSFMPAPDPADELAAEAEEDVEEQTEELIDVAKELEEVEEIVEPEEEAAEKVDEAMAEEAEDAADAFEALEEEEEAEGFEAEVGGAEAAAAAPESSEALDSDSDSDSDSVSASAPAPAPDALAPLDYDSAPAPAPDASSDPDADLDPTAAEIVASLGALIAERSASGDRLRAALGRASAESSAESADATLGASAKLVAFDEDEWEDETAAELEEEEEEDETLYDEKRDEAAAEPGKRRNRRRAKKTSSREADADHLRRSKRQAASSGSSSSSSSSSHQHRQRLTASQKRLGWKSGDAAALTPEKIAKHAESGGAKGALSRRFVDSLPETIPARERPFQKWAAMTDDQIVAAPADIGAVGDARASSDAADVTAVAATKSESSSTAKSSTASSKKTSSKKASADASSAAPSSAAPSKKPAAEEDSETEDVRDSVSAAQKKTLKRPPPKSTSELEAARASLEARAAEEAAAKLALEAEAQAEAEKEFDTTLEAVQQAIEDSRRDDRPISSFMLAPISVVGVLGVVAIAILLVSNRGDPLATGGAGYQGGPGDPRDKEERRRLLGNAADDGKIRPPADSGANLRALFTSAGMRDANGRGAGPGSQRDALEKLPGATESESESVHDLERGNGNGAAARTSQSRGFFGDQGSTAPPPPASDAFFRRAAEFTDGLVRFGSRAAEGVRESAARTARMANLGAGDDRLSVRSDHFGGAPNGVDAAAGIHGSRASASADLSSPRFPDAAGVAAVAAMAASEVGPPRGAFSRREMASQSAAGSRDPLASPRSGGGSSAGMSGISRPRTEPPVVGVGVASRRVPAPLGAFDRAPGVPGTRSPARSIDREFTGGSPSVTPAVPAGPPFHHVAFDAGLASGQTSPDAAALRGRIRRAPDFNSEGESAGSAHRAAFAAPPRPHLQARAVKAETTTTTGVLLEREAAEAATGFSTTRDADGDGGGFRGSSAPETEDSAAVARKMYEHVAGAGRPVPREEPPRVVKSTTRFL